MSGIHSFLSLFSLSATAYAFIWPKIARFWVLFQGFTKAANSISGLIAVILGVIAVILGASAVVLPAIAAVLGAFAVILGRCFIFPKRYLHVFDRVENGFRSLRWGFGVETICLPKNFLIYLLIRFFHCQVLVGRR